MIFGIIPYISYNYFKLPIAYVTNIILIFSLSLFIVDWSFVEWPPYILTLLLLPVVSRIIVLIVEKTINFHKIIIVVLSCLLLLITIYYSIAKNKFDLKPIDPGSEIIIGELDFKKLGQKQEENKIEEIILPFKVTDGISGESINAKLSYSEKADDFTVKNVNNPLSYKVKITGESRSDGSGEVKLEYRTKYYRDIKGKSFTNLYLYATDLSNEDGKKYYNEFVDLTFNREIVELRLFPMNEFVDSYQVSKYIENKYPQYEFIGYFYQIIQGKFLYVVRDKGDINNYFLLKFNPYDKTLESRKCTSGEINECKDQLKVWAT